MNNIKNKILWVAFIAFITFISFLFGSSLLNKNPAISPREIKLISGDELTTKGVKIPAVSENGGVIGELNSIKSNGTGKIKVDITETLIRQDTSQSLRMAYLNAFNKTDLNKSNYDITYLIEANSPVVSGSSAGLAAYIATLASLKNRTINRSVTCTGTINHDGTIGPASKIIKKAKAAEKANLSMVLVPETQKMIENITSTEYCRDYGSKEFCSTEYKTRKQNIEEIVEIEVREVETAEEAEKYFFTKNKAKNSNS